MTWANFQDKLMSIILIWFIVVGITSISLRWLWSKCSTCKQFPLCKMPYTNHQLKLFEDSSHKTYLWNGRSGLSLFLKSICHTNCQYMCVICEIHFPKTTRYSLIMACSIKKHWFLYTHPSIYEEKTPESRYRRFTHICDDYDF